MHSGKLMLLASLGFIVLFAQVGLGQMPGSSSGRQLWVGPTRIQGIRGAVKDRLPSPIARRQRSTL